jgi:hypothetical protein
MILTTPIQSAGYERFFAFGCSYTNYHWATWADIIARHMDIPSYNYGSPGTPITAAVDALYKANKHYKFTDKDLVIVQWTHLSRFARFTTKELLWETNTKIDFFDAVKNNLQITDVMYILAVMALAKDAYSFFQFSMVDNKDFLQNYIRAISRKKAEAKKISEYVELYSELLTCTNMQDTIANKEWNYNVINYGLNDSHPLPLEQLKFVESELGLKVNSKIVDKVNENQDFILANKKTSNLSRLYEDKSNKYFKNFYTNPII